MPRKNDLEQQALQIIVSHGKEGIRQRDLWRALGASSREGSRLALRLERKGLIYREQELYEGRWTYRLIAKHQPPTFDSLVGVPCIACPDSDKCYPGGMISPERCERLEKWLLQNAAKAASKNPGEEAAEQ